MGFELKCLQVTYLLASAFHQRISPYGQSHYFKHKRGGGMDVPACAWTKVKGHGSRWNRLASHQDSLNFGHERGVDCIRH